MINVDISNIWGALSLPDLLSMEQEVSAAHMSLEGNAFLPCSSGELLRLLAAADRLRSLSQVCVVVGNTPACTAARAAIELLQGQDRNLSRGSTGDPRIFFAGNSFSTRQWDRLKQQLEGTDFSVAVISGTRFSPESAITLRNLKWMLDRRYGTDEASRRICAVADDPEDSLYRMAQLHGWELLPGAAGGNFRSLSPAALLPMAVAGLDVAALLAGTEEVWELLELRSFENPLWLYTAVRNLMHRQSRQTELLAFWEPDFAAFGHWWQQLFAGAESTPEAPAILTAACPEEDSSARSGRFATALRFEPTVPSWEVPFDVHDTDGCNALAGQSLSEVQEQSFRDTLDTWVDSGTPVLTMDCGSLCEQSLGALFYFLEVSRSLSARISGGIPPAPAPDAV